MRILVLRLSSLGDIALLSSVFEEIRRAYPACHLACLVKPDYAGLLSSHGFVNEVILFKGFTRALAVLRSQKWDVILDLHGVLRTRALAALVPASRKIAYGKNVLGRWAMILRLAKPKPDTHVVERYRRALIPLGIGLKRVAVLQSAFLGDAVLTLGLLERILSDLRPDYLTVVTQPEHREIFERDGINVLADDKRGKGAGLPGIIRMIRLLRQERFDAVFIPHRSFRSAFLAWAARVPLRVGFSNSAGRFLFSRSVAFDWSMHDSQRNASLLDCGLPQVSNDDQKFKPWVKTPNPAIAREFWLGAGLDPQKDFLVAMAPGSKWATKRWMPERFAQLGLQLKARYPRARFVLLGAPEDRVLCAQIAELLGEDCVNLAGQVSLKELGALISELNLFVTNDSGPMHLAYSSGIPTVAIFGPTVKGFGFFPQGEASRVVEVKGLSCRPCSLHGGRQCPRGHFLCMELIGVGDVLEACEEALASRESRVESPTASARLGTRY